MTEIKYDLMNVMSEMWIRFDWIRCKMLIQWMTNQNFLKCRWMLITFLWINRCLIVNYTLFDEVWWSSSSFDCFFSLSWSISRSWISNFWNNFLQLARSFFFIHWLCWSFHSSHFILNSECALRRRFRSVYIIFFATIFFTS